ncbi:hypothetical protein QBC32DRAFT_344400 [Pseudoneurospora amorphoporcata]|uniref:Uncharacterized protein n=1 Tax=Pseudoneurospora amorphoporcata TaxID=241081 RepID=A0AAN6SF21_9PEZI|nr:hypothetical protein QBC32DRAFT_344400 [Pseudoneurospora amorphoporcata]
MMIPMILRNRLWSFFFALCLASFAWFSGLVDSRFIFAWFGLGEHCNNRREMEREMEMEMERERERERERGIFTWGFSSVWPCFCGLDHGLAFVFSA